MAFRRLSLQLQQADWFAAGVNVLGVLLGVLLAFQVERWGETRREREVERAFLERLWTESNLNLRRMESLRDYNQTRMEEILEIHRAFSDPARLSQLQRTPEFGCGMLHLPAPRLSQTAYQELVEGDRLDILRDERLKELLRIAVAQHAFVAGQLTYFRDAFNQYRPTLLPYHRWAVDTEEGDVECSLDLLALSQDAQARALLSAVYRDQRVFFDFRSQETRMLREQRDHLACLLDKPDCPQSGRQPGGGSRG